MDFALDFHSLKHGFELKMCFFVLFDFGMRFSLLVVIMLGLYMS